MEDRSESIARRSITAALWNFTSSAVQVILGVGRSILLTRLLPVDIFGIYALANAIVGISGIVAQFGMEGAFLHRAIETENEDQAAAVHFTLKLITTLLWASTLITISFIGFTGLNRVALLIITTTSTILHLTETARLILIRRVVHRRLAVISLLDDIISTIVALTLALRGVTLWALLATNIITATLRVIFLYVWRPVWRPHLTWSPRRVIYFIKFGSQNFLSNALLEVLDRVDDLWTGFFLGETPLGFYSRAYNFATYPRKIIALPINAVAGGTYAELINDRKRLSKAFFRTNAFLIRTGFLLAGLLALIAPEFIRLALGEKWLPMLNAFRLMLVFTLLDPIRLTIADLFIAVGRPEQVAKSRTIQLVVMVFGLFTLGSLLGITGVALTVDLMLLVGIGLLLYQSRAYVDFSLSKLFVVPVFSLTVSLLLARSTLLLVTFPGSDWVTAAVKVSIFLPMYVGSMLLLEFKQTIKMIKSISELRAAENS